MILLKELEKQIPKTMEYNEDEHFDVRHCDIVIYSKKYLVFVHFWHRAPKNPWNFLSDENYKKCFLLC